MREGAGAPPLSPAPAGAAAAGPLREQQPQGPGTAEPTRAGEREGSVSSHLPPQGPLGGRPGSSPPVQPRPPRLTAARQHQRLSRRRSRRGRRTRPEIRRSFPGSLRAYLAFMTSPPGVLLRANGAPVLMRLTQSALSRGGAPGAVRGWRPPGRGALLVLVVVVKTWGVGACVGKDPDAAPLANNGGHKAAAAVAPGTCSLRGAGGGRWPFSGKTCRNIIYASNPTRAAAEEGGLRACTGLSSGRSQDRGLGQQRAGSPAPLPLQGRAGLREQRFPAAI